MGSPLPLVCQMESPIWSMLLAADNMIVSANSRVFIKMRFVIAPPPLSMDSGEEYTIEGEGNTLRFSAKNRGQPKPPSLYHS